jgi:hypothetical protein
MARVLPLLALALAASATASPLPPRAPNPDTELVTAHVLQHMNETWNPAQGALAFPFLSPAGPYRGELWDWDSVFLGVATSPSSLPYFLGSMLNFLAATNLTDGDVKGCLTPNGATETLYHAKPIIIQGAYIAATLAGGSNYSLFKPYAAQMNALLAYWETAEGRVDNITGLHRWHDQLETGCDNLVYSECPSAYSDCWDEARDAFTLSSPDLEIFLAREHTAYARFLQKWGAEEGEEAASAPSSSSSTSSSPRPLLLAEADAHLATARLIADRVDTYLWVWTDDAKSKGYYGAFNTSSRSVITNRAFQMAWPLWGGFANETLARAAVAQLLEPDMWTDFGVASVSNLDPRYNNDVIIDPYSNWRGPLWVNVNTVLAFSLNAAGYAAEAAQLADSVVHTLAEDLRQTGTWHECYSTVNGSGLAAPGFLSWNTLGMTLQGYIAAGVDPFDLS